MRISHAFWIIMLLLIIGASIFIWPVPRANDFEWRETMSFNEQAHLVVVEAKYPLGSWFSPDALEFGVDRIIYYERGVMGDHVIEIEYQDIDSIRLVEGVAWWKVDIGMPGSLFSRHYRIYFTRDETAEVVRRTIRAHFYADFRYEEKKSLWKRVFNQLI